MLVKNQLKRSNSKELHDKINFFENFTETELITYYVI